MSLQVNDPRSRSRSKSPGRSRSRSRSRTGEDRATSPTPSVSLAPSPSTTRPRSRSPAVEIAPKSTSASASAVTSKSKSRSSRRSYGSDDEAEIERQYKLMKESRRGSDEERNVDSRNVLSRVPRSPARYDIVRSDEEGEPQWRVDKRERERVTETSRRREERYEHSADESEDDRPRQYASRKPSSPRATASHLIDSDEDSVDDDLAYGDAPGSHPSYARPSRYQYAQPAQYLHAQPVAPRQPTDWAPVPECERPGFVPPSQAGQSSTMPGGFPPASAYDVPTTTAPSFPSPQYAGLSAHQPIPYAQHGSSAPYAPAAHHRTASAGDIHVPPAHYAQPAQYQYAQMDPHVRYTSKATPVQPYAASPQQQFGRSQATQPEQTIYPYRYSHEPQFADKFQLQPQAQQHQVVEITPGGGRSPARPHSLSVSSMNSLAVAGGLATHRPASPLLEPYRGTYQSMSPMPSPMMMPSRDDDLSDLEPLDGATSNSESGRRKKRSSDSEKDSRYKSSKDKTKEKAKDKEEKRRSRGSGHDRQDSGSSMRESMVLISPTSGRKRVSFYDAAADATAMQSALNHTRNIDNKTIIQVLPRLTSDEILLLRQEYKHNVKMHGKGINLAKHLRLKLGNSSFGKVAYATALGRWESEAYWANCYYQAGTSRRELLIESLMGRSNAAIREIKNCFRDTRYNDSLEKCMRAELKADKFRTAVLLALEERRMDERESIDPRLVRQDVADLHRALITREGGETAMLYIIVLRSDNHLREVLRAHESIHGVNFARAMIAKSRNLVGETLAHILNGAINRPMRDALLLHQALRESRSGRERSELLISRLVRLHWEPRHLELVKSEYRRRYGERLEEGIAEEIMGSTGGSEWGEFCVELARSPSSSSSS